jgi:hypothetical protein
MDACMVDTCDPVLGCQHAPADCDDMDACTADTCDIVLGCQHAPPSCDDGDACTTDTCDPVLGCQHPPADCDDMDSCTLDTCDVVTGCQHEPDPGATPPGTPVQLAGHSLSGYPFFDYVRAFNVDASVEVALDPTRYPALGGDTCDVYVVTSRTDAEWCADGTLVDARGMPDTRVFGSVDIQSCTFPLIAPNQLPGNAGATLGVGYDVVLDCDQDALLSASDFVDGLGAESGLYLVHDITQPGSLATSTFEEIGPLPPWPGPWASEGDDYRVYYPAVLDDPSFVGTFPLVIVSHGNGHSFAWYDDLQQHLASYGTIVLAHDNDTIFGIEQASSSTLYWTDYVIENQDTMGGGVLNGHIDDTRITWIGHSRGGEGVARAYDRLHDEGFTPTQFTIDDVVLVSSMAPTDFLGNGQSNAHEVAYDLIYGSADGDVNGCADNDVATSFNLYERAAGPKSSHYLHGASHEHLHDCEDGGDEGMGPDRMPCPEVHDVQMGHYTALFEHHVEGNVPGKDFLWRQYESLRPIGTEASSIVDNDFKDAAASGVPVVDDYQTQTGTDTSSSGGAVTFTVANLAEELMDDEDGVFDWAAFDEMNGMTRCNTTELPNDDQRACVFDFNGASFFYQLDVVPSQRDFSDDTYLSLRACQGTRHPETTPVLADLTFTVALTDGDGSVSAIDVSAYGGGLEEPYQRTGCGNQGTGWANEMEVIRIRLTDFLNNGSGLDLTDVTSIRLRFGSSHGSTEGRVGLDDVYLSPD